MELWKRAFSSLLSVSLTHSLTVLPPHSIPNPPTNIIPQSQFRGITIFRAHLVYDHADAIHSGAMHALGSSCFSVNGLVFLKLMITYLILLLSLTSFSKSLEESPFHAALVQQLCRRRKPTSLDWSGPAGSILGTLQSAFQAHPEAVCLPHSCCSRLPLPSPGVPSVSLPLHFLCASYHAFSFSSNMGEKDNTAHCEMCVLFT